MNNLLSYCGLVDARISASEKDLLPVINTKYLNRLYLRALLPAALLDFDNKTEEK